MELQNVFIQSNSIFDTIIRSYEYHYDKNVLPVCKRLLSNIESQSNIFVELHDPQKSAF